MKNPILYDLVCSGVIATFVLFCRRFCIDMEISECTVTSRAVAGKPENTADSSAFEDAGHSFVLLFSCFSRLGTFKPPLDYVTYYYN